MSWLPDECSVAFKEWSQICQALAEGRQILIARKGGIREGPGGFTPEHSAFWLYPTFVHQAEQDLRGETLEAASSATSAPAPAPADPVAISALAVVQQVWHVRAESDVDALTPFHVWTIETLRKRFHYRRIGLWVLAVRIYRQAEPWTLVPTAEQLGCKSWVMLDSARPTTALKPTLTDPQFADRLAQLQSVLGPEPSPQSERATGPTPA